MSSQPPPASVPHETDLAIGPRAIEAYSRLSYTMWYALAEFIDNSTQSRENHGGIIDSVLQQEGTPLVVTITYDRTNKELLIEDNSIGMTYEKLVNALRIAQPTKDSRGRSKYGMGLKTAACWIGNHWEVITTEWASGQEWTATIDVDAIVKSGGKVPLSPRAVDSSAHYTKIRIRNLNRVIQRRTEDNIRNYLGSMYRMDLRAGRLKLVYGTDDVGPPEQYEFDTDAQGKEMRRPVETTINQKQVKGWFGVLRAGSGGRKFGGFSIFQHERQIQGFPTAWKPKSIFGGVDEEGANNLVAQRLTGELQLDGFDVSHTKDAILFKGTEEDELEEFLRKETDEWKRYAQRRRGGQKNSPWARDKIEDMVKDLKTEFSSPEMKDALNTVLPPLDTITRSNATRVASAKDGDQIAVLHPLPDLVVHVYWQMKSEEEPHVTIQAAAQSGTVHVLLNGMHPYFCSIESVDAVREMIRQYIYDALAEYKVSKQHAQMHPDSVRRSKHELLRAQVIHIENEAHSAEKAAAPTSEAPNAGTSP